MDGRQQAHLIWWISTDFFHHLNYVFSLHILKYFSTAFDNQIGRQTADTSYLIDFNRFCFIIWNISVHDLIIWYLYVIGNVSFNHLNYFFQLSECLNCLFSSIWIRKEELRWLGWSFLFLSPSFVGQNVESWYH